MNLSGKHVEVVRLSEYNCAIQGDIISIHVFFMGLTVDTARTSVADKGDDVNFCDVCFLDQDASQALQSSLDPAKTEVVLSPIVEKQRHSLW